MFYQRNGNAKFKERKHNMKRNVFWLGLVSMFNDLASEMIYPVVPLFLTTTLGAPMAVVGLIEGAAESTASLLKVFSGWFSDWLGKRKPLAVFGYAFSTLSRLILAAACGWPMVLAGRFVDRFGKGVRVTARDALIADSTEEKNRGAAFGFHRAMDTIGAVGGSLLAFVFVAYLTLNYRLIFLLSLVPALLGVLILQVFVCEVKTSSIKEKLKLSWHNFGIKYNLFLFISIVFSLGNSSDVFLILRSKDLGISASMVILAYAVYNIFYAVFSYPAGVMADRIGFRRVLLAGFFVFALVYAGFGTATRSLSVWFLFPIYGFYIAFTEGVGKAYITNIVPKEKIGTALGFYYAATGIAVLLASLAAGWLWSAFGAPAAFYYGAAMSLLACILFVTLSL